MRGELRSLIAGGLLAAAALTSATGPVAATDQVGLVEAARPNILFISTDDLRVRDLRVMPNVKALITDLGTNFTTSYAPFPLCCPARANWLTGQYNHNNGVDGNASNDSPTGGYQALDSTNTVVTWLRDAGYQTAYIGRYLNGYGTVKPVAVPPGWQEWHAVGGPNDWLNPLILENDTGTLKTTKYPGEYLTDKIDSIANTILRTRTASDAPLFLWVSHFAPHAGGPAEPDDPPLGNPPVPARWKDFYAQTALPKTASYNEADVTDKPAYVRSRGPISSTREAAVKELNAQRWESLKAVDESVRNMMATLRETGELANTVVVFSSDNGYMLGEHRILAGKIVPYEASTRVPLIFRGPGFPAAVTRSKLTANIDVPVTFADLANTAPKRLVDGRSLLPLAADPSTWPARRIPLMAGPATIDGPDRYHGVRTGRYKYIRYSTGERELYDLSTDPDEMVNLVPDPAFDAREAALDEVTTRLMTCKGELACR